ncbi:MAG: hypothetical protein WC666_00470 [Candidatus Paceibacterota bacterium]|jgi:hypothetical protein
MNRAHFFSLAEMKQPVNQWLCIAFMGLWVFWFLLFYVVDRTKTIGEAYVFNNLTGESSEN